MRADATAVLAAWVPPDAGQRQLRDDYLAFLAEHDDAMWRSCRVGHLTASALVMDERRERVLLTLHPKVGRWLQLGGHCEPEDASLREAARREAIEESGIAAVLVGDQPLRLDRHPVPCAGAMSEHLDVQYLAIVASDAQAIISDESDDLRWFPVDALPADLDASVLALVAAALKVPA
ncbi:MAG: NUDIX domain-containing protein [Actinobacteria bacterium]|nr:NUDIX domain-containing protein [Actinomycetota bacterium]